MQFPYVYTSERAFVRQEVSFDNENGVGYKETGGEHSIWAARVPFLPAMMSDDFTRAGRQRIPLIMQRQFRFIYDLSRAREHRTTFELRFISTPNPRPGQPNLVDIVFLGKVFSTRPESGKALALQLWEKFASNFPLEDPFNYPLEPITDEDGFWACYEPIPFDQLQSSNVLEIRKYEDMPIRSTAALGRVERIGDYIAHPFVPALDKSGPMGRFIAALADQPEKCYVGVSLRPTRMFDQEIQNVSFAIGQFKRTVTDDDGVAEEYIRTRSIIAVDIYEQLMQEREQLSLMRVHVVGHTRTPLGLAEAFGSEMIANAASKYPTQWATVCPADDVEWQAARHNLVFLEHDMWGHTIAAPPLQRLRYLMTAQWAYGAFRLPIPPESGYMPGILVKSEPFIAPADELELRQEVRANSIEADSGSAEGQQQRKIVIGTVYHRGNRTQQPFRINVRDLIRHALIAGSTGSGKTTTIRHILTQLWLQHRVPFLVLYPLDKPDYRELLGFPDLAHDLLIFTLGDESTSPFRFNPFEVPEGLLLKTHLSRLMRVFTAAFSLWDPLPMIFREALRRAYRDKGWDTVLERGVAGRDYPIMSEFYSAIDQITSELAYSSEAKDNIRQASVIRIGDLLENAGYVVNVRSTMAMSTVMNQPTIMEIGRVGSMEDIALLMGFLLIRFAEEVERRPRQPDHPHVTVVEEAHRLMAKAQPVSPFSGNTRTAAGEDFSNILAEVRGHGEAIIVAEQIPTLLVEGAIGNTYLKLMHWLEDAPSFELFSSIMNLNEQQKEYARTLTPGFAIARSPFGKPVHLKVPEFGDQAAFDGSAASDVSDARVAKFMSEQRKRFDLDDLEVVSWTAGLQARSSESPNPENQLQTVHLVANRLLNAPMRTCAYCRSLLFEGKCPHRTQMLEIQQTESYIKRAQMLDTILSLIDDDERRDNILRFGKRIEALSTRAMAYCYFAHLADRALQTTSPESANEQQRKAQYLALLSQFDRYFPMN